MANKRLVKKFDEPVHAAIQRSQRWPTTQWRPSFTCGHIFGRGFASSCCGGDSRWRIEIMNTEETTKLIASATIAYGAVSAAISPPAADGPATCAMLTVSCSFELP